MPKRNIVKEKSFAFAIEIVSAYKVLVSEKREFTLSKQILRSGTSVGANIREAEQAESKRDFIHKMSIALKEANETAYWLDLLHKTDYLPENKFQELNITLTELLRLLVSIINTSKIK